MNDVLFENIDKENDCLWVAKEFFNTVNNMFFVRTIDYLVSGTSYGDEYAGCDFPDDLEGDEDVFEGVRFSYSEQEIIVSESVFEECLILACDNYLKFHPEKKIEIASVLKKLKAV